jgi:hypothetical protein
LRIANFKLLQCYFLTATLHISTVPYLLINYFGCHCTKYKLLFSLCLIISAATFFLISLLPMLISLLVFSLFHFPKCKSLFTYFLLISLLPMLISLLVFSLFHFPKYKSLFSSSLPKLLPFLSSLFSILSSLFFFFISQSTKLFFCLLFPFPCHNKSQNSPLQFPNCRPFLSKSSSDFFFFSAFPYFSFSSHFVNTTNLSSLQSWCEFHNLQWCDRVRTSRVWVFLRVILW